MNNKLDGLSMDLEKTNMEKLKSVFPECFSEQKLDIDKLLSLCGEYIDNDFEKYKFEWKGKSECLRLAQKRSTGTLRPCREESVNFDDTENVYIEGDNLEVLKLLQTAYYNKIKMIYIDPPYNTGNDFVYEDDFADPMARYKEVTQQTTKSNPETMGRYHTNWLNMMYPRLRLAANLLRDDGVIFISIDDNEVFNLKKVCDEVFGEENFVAQLIWQKKTGASDAANIATITENVLVFAKQIDDLHLTQNYDAHDSKRYKYKDKYYNERGAFYYDSLDRGTLGYHESLDYPVLAPDGSRVFPNGRTSMKNDGWRWKWSKEKLEWGINNGFIEVRENSSKDVGWGVYYKIYEKVDNDGKKINRSSPHKNLLQDVLNTHASSESKEIFGRTDFFSNPKPINLIKHFVNLGANKDDIILDFFSGSATTAHAVMQLNAEDGGNRKFIMVQLPELCDEKSEAYKAGYKNICEIGKERIRRAGQKILKEFSDNAEITMQNAEMKDEENISALLTLHSALDTGFKVFKLDTSNLKLWDNTPITGDDQIEMFTERMNSMIDSIKDDRTDMDVVYEVMLKMGVPLDVPVQYIEVNGKIVYIVGEFLLMIALLDNITAEDIESIAAYAPAKIICAESSFKDDSALSNAHYILRDKQIELKLV